MDTVKPSDFRSIHVPATDSHKGQNGRMLLIGGSQLFHAASLWALTVASRIVDLVHYSSVPENNEIVLRAKEDFRNGIVIPRNDIESYIEEDDVILIGPGMTRDDETAELTNRLLGAFPDKQWVIDAGALQMMDISLIPNHSILTPHHAEFASLIERTELSLYTKMSDEERVMRFARSAHCIVLLKGHRDIASDGTVTKIIEGGNAGMTKGGTGDVLAGLIAALACKNEPMTAVMAGSYINKYAGDDLFTSVGPYFNASDLASQIPRTMKALFF